MIYLTAFCCNNSEVELRVKGESAASLRRLLIQL